MDALERFAPSGGMDKEIRATGFCNPCLARREVVITKFQRPRKSDGKGPNGGNGSCPVCGKGMFTYISKDVMPQANGTDTEG